MRSQNPFDKAPTDLPLMRFIVHTDSFSKEFIADDPVITNLAELSHLMHCEVIFTPTKEIKIREKLTAYGVPLTKYTFDGHCLSLRGENLSRLLGYSMPSEPDQAVIKGSRLSKLDVVALFGVDCDYCIVNSEEVFLSSRPQTSRMVTPEYAINLFRILMVNHRKFYIAPGRPVNEGFYYLYRYKKLFHNYQLAWSTIVSTPSQEESLRPGGLFGQLDSLSRRLEYSCRAADQTSYYALKTADNDTQDSALYHFAYLIMLATGVFDDLAWSINYRYSFDLRRHDVVLKQKSKFELLEKLGKVNSKLHQYLGDEETQAKINLFYPLRDALMHRKFVSGFVQVSGGSRINRYYLPDEMAEAINAISPADGGGSWGLTSDFHIPSVELHSFTEKAVSTLAEIVNTVLFLLEWDELIAAMPEKEGISIRQAQERFEEGLGKFLGWGREPLYF